MTIEDIDFSTSGIVNPAANALGITPADVDLAVRTRAVYVGTTGNLTVMMAGENNPIVTFPNVIAGSLLPIRVIQIRAASTAAGIVAVW